MKCEDKHFEKLTSEQIDVILKKIDTDGNKEIEYIEFMAHSLSRKQLNEENLSAFFHTMLPEKEYRMEDGVITLNAPTIQKYCQKSGRVYDLSQINEMMDEVNSKLEKEFFDSTSDIDFGTFYRFITEFIDDS